MQKELTMQAASEDAGIMMSHATTLMWMADESGNLVNANDSFYRHFGAEKPTFNKNIYDIAPKDIADFFLDKHRQVKKKGITYRKLHHFNGADGTSHTFLVNIYPIKNDTRPIIGGEAWNVTDKYRIYQKLKKIHNRLLRANRCAPDAFWEWDIETGQIFRNQALQNLIGFNPDNTQDLSWWLQRIHPEDRVRVQTSIDAIIAQKANSWHQDYRFKFADGTYRTIADKGYIQYNQDKPVRMIGFLQNTLEVKELECLLQREKTQQEIKIAETIVEAQERERTYIGHELHDNVSQILVSARIYLGLLNPESEDEKTIQSKTSGLILTAIEEIRRLSQKLAVTQLKANGLISSIEQLLTDIRNTGLFNVKFTSSIDIDTEYSLPEDKKIALFRIVQEQMNNIIKHSRAGKIRVNLMQNNSEIVLYTYDDGIGFDLRLVNKGMGLSNIYTRAKSFNGLVDIITAPGQGCAVTVLMPYD